MFLVYFITLLLMMSLFLVILRHKKENKSFYITLGVYIVVIISFTVYTMVNKYRSDKKDYKFSDYKLDPNAIVPTLVCNTTNLKGYRILLDVLGGTDTIKTVTSIGECNLIKDYVANVYLRYIVKSAGIDNIYIITKSSDSVFGLTNIKTGSRVYSDITNKERQMTCSMGGVCNYRERDSFMFKAAQDETYFYDFLNYDEITNTIVYYRSVNVKLSTTQCISSIFILGKSGSVGGGVCKETYPSDYEIGETPECFNNIITTPDPVIRGIDQDIIYYGRESLTCYGIIYIIELIIKKEGMCRAIKILNSNIDSFGFGISEFLPFIYRYDKLKEEIYAEVNQFTEYIGLTVQDISKNVLESSIENVKEENREEYRKTILGMMRTDIKSIFGNIIDGKNVNESVFIHGKHKKPIIMRTIVKIFNIDNEPYNYYFVGSGYTLSYIKPILFNS